MPHVLCLRPVHPEALAMLRAAPGVTVEIIADPSPAGLQTPEAAAALAKADAVIVRATRIDADFLARAPQLKIVARHGVGYDQVDVPTLTQRGIPLTVTADANAASVAEHALMLMLVTARRAREYDAATRALRWGAQEALPTFDLGGRTVLIVGFGRIGGRVARLCLAFGMRVLVHDPYVPGNTIKGAGCVPAPDLHAGLGEADVVTLHCPSNETTRGLVDARFLAATQRGATLINTARGTLVDEAALTNALRCGQIGAAGLDVFHTEPVATALPLLELPNLVVTPHIAAGTEQGMRRMGLSCVDSILACFDGRLDPDVVINRDVLRRNA
jgi:D-3-phosphoglycerate dehydrogenase / 2-oxoglutarate reductase